MRILWICGARVVGGAERVSLHLLERLRARGHRLDALLDLASPVHGLTDTAGLAVVDAPLSPSLHPRALHAIGHACRRLEPDITLVTTSAQWPAACLARRSRTRLVLVRHMVLPLSLPMRRLAGRRADAVVAVSHAVREGLLARPGIAAHKLHVILNPVRISPRATLPSASERAAARAALRLPGAPHWVGFFGGLNAAKGLQDVLHAVRHANDRVGATHLLVCGPRSGLQGSALPSLLRELGLQDRVQYLGEIENVVDAFTAVDAVVMATHRALSEALPATLCEAMACGTPVLGYATGGISEVIGTDERCGWLAAADDTHDLGRVLVEVLSDPHHAQQRALAALARARDLFDPERAADRYEQLFTALCTPNAPQRAPRAE